MWVQMFAWLYFFRVSVCLFFLAVASFFDFKSREVPDWVWLLFAPIGLALTLSLLALNGWHMNMVVSWIIVLVVVSGLSIALFYLGFFGGADAKALICLAIAMPDKPSLPTKLALKSPIWWLHMPLPISAFNNSVLMASLLTLAFITKNIADLIRGEEIFKGLEDESFPKKILAFITGYRVNVEKLRSKRHHYLLIEDFNKCSDGSIKRRLKLLNLINSHENKREEALDGVHGKVWVTPGLPFLAFITVGFAIAVFIGDIILWIISLALT